jgi:hypothetical protein
MRGWSHGKTGDPTLRTRRQPANVAHDAARGVETLEDFN